MPYYKVKTAEGQGIFYGRKPIEAQNKARKGLLCSVTGIATDEDIDFHIGMGGFDPRKGK